MSDISSSVAYYVRELRDYPDGNIIQHITQLAIQNVSSAQQIVDVIASILSDQRTLPTHKRPLFYLVDSILKRAGGPYAFLFQQRFQATFPLMIGNMPPEDRKKLDFLLGTWNERRFFSEEFLRDLKMQLQTVKSLPTQYISSIPQPIQQMPAHGSFGSSNMLFNNNSSFGPSMSNSQPMPTSMPARDDFEGYLRIQMQKIMDDIFAGLDTNTVLTLDQLKMVNPDLYKNIRNQAEIDVKNLWMQNGGVQDQSMNMQQHRNLPLAPSIPSSTFKRNVEQVYESSSVPDGQHRQTFQSPGLAASNTLPQDVSNLSIPSDLVKGFIAEVPVVVDILRVQQLSDTLSKMTQQAYAPKVPTVVLESIASKLSKRLAHYVDNVMVPPPLPDILESSGDLIGLENLHPNKSQSVAPTSNRMNIPEFKLTDLDRFPEVKNRGIMALYGGEQFREDGLRFKTVTELRAYTDAFLEKKKLLLKKKDQRERVCREWNCTLDQWISNFGELKSAQDQKDVTNASRRNDQDDDEEYIVPADEHFVRCPISHEAFVQDWDYEAGENIFHNAVRVLITSSGDPNILKFAQPIYTDSANGPTTVNGIQYLIVHKLLVMDRWLAEGKAKTVLEVLEHLKQQQHSLYAVDLIDRINQACGDEDEEDVFVILDDTMR